MSEFIEAHRKDAAIGGMVEHLEGTFGALQLATGQIAQSGLKDPEEAGAAATDYLRLLGLVVMGYMFVRSAAIAHAKVGDAGPDAGFYRAKVASAQLFIDRILPQATALFLEITSGQHSTMALGDAAF